LMFSITFELYLGRGSSGSKPMMTDEFSVLLVSQNRILRSDPLDIIKWLSANMMSAFIELSDRFAS
jgi:hypothetical protein